MRTFSNVLDRIATLSSDGVYIDFTEKNRIEYRDELGIVNLSCTTRLDDSGFGFIVTLPKDLKYTSELKERAPSKDEKQKLCSVLKEAAQSLLNANVSFIDEASLTTRVAQSLKTLLLREEVGSEFEVKELNGFRLINPDTVTNGETRMTLDDRENLTYIKNGKTLKLKAISSFVADVLFSHAVYFLTPLRWEAPNENERPSEEDLSNIKEDIKVAMELWESIVSFGFLPRQEEGYLEKRLTEELGLEFKTAQIPMPRGDKL